MEFKIGKMLEGIGLQERERREGESTSDYLDYLVGPGTGEGVRAARERSMVAGIAHELTGDGYKETNWPGYGAVGGMSDQIHQVTPVVE